MNPLPKSVLCRLCLYRSEFSIDIFDENGKHGYVAAEVIEELLQLHVRREDGYPQSVCAKCLNKLTDFKVFKSQCYNSHEMFDKQSRVLSSSGVMQFSNPCTSSSKGLPEETVTDDYFPGEGGPGCVQVKTEKVDPDDCTSYDEDGAEGISAEVVIKTESIGCDETFTQAIVASEVDEDGLLSRPDVTSGAFGGSQYERMRIHEVWGTIGDGISEGERQQDGFQHHADSYLRLQASQGMGRGQGAGLLMMEGNSRAIGMALAGQQPPAQEEFVCPQCGKSFAYLCYMNKHIRMTHNRELCERKHECEVCKMRFAKRGNLERHSMVHKGVRSFSCERCGKAFFHHSELQAHASSHLKVNPYTCDYCQKGFSDKLHLIEHINRHTGGKPFLCRSCGKQFVSVKNLKVHERIHEPNPSYRCEQCNKTFTNRFYFLGHQRKHSGELFGCLECGKTFVHKYSLKQHEALHREDGGFICEVCGKKFDKKNHLRVHTMLHTGERPFECEYCTKRFHVASHLRVHLKLHTGERSFYCDFCGKGFVQKSHYVDHVRVHTGERPYSCTECSRAFCQRQQLRQHMKTHNKGRAMVGASVKTQAIVG